MQNSNGTDSPRRLATILAADIAGYSRLMSADEEGTAARVKRHRRELIEPTVADHHGRIVKWMGDGFLAEFASPVEAVRCAVIIQQSMSGRNAAQARQHWIQFRIGVNLGDIISDADDIFGDGVNLAARLQELCAPGGVYISGGIYELVKNKLVVGYQSLGDQKVKNITDPVRVYSVLPDPEAMSRARFRRRMAAAAAVAACVAGGSIYWWQVQAPAARDGVNPPVVAAAVPSAAPPVVVAPAPPPPAPPPVVVEAPPQPAVPPQPAASEQRQVAAAPPRLVVPPVKGPEVVSLPGSTFLMGSSEDPSEKPVHRVTVGPFSLAKYLVTVREWKECVVAGACPDIAAGDANAPMTNVSWSDAQQFASWLSKSLNQNYRLPSEAEWEYAARGGTQTKYWWGNELAMGMANCKGCGEPYDPRHPLQVGSFPPNPFGLHDMTGGVAEWVADCWHHDYAGAPGNGAAWDEGNCSKHVLRGGSWQNDASYVRAASRDAYDTSVRYVTHGFRVARSP